MKERSRSRIALSIVCAARLRGRSNFIMRARTREDHSATSLKISCSAKPTHAKAQGTSSFEKGSKQATQDAHREEKR